jgi:uncharacterized protein
MQLLLQNPDSAYFIRRGDAQSVTVIDRLFTHSFAVGIDRLLEDWPVTSTDAIEPVHTDALLDLKPEVVLLGTGLRIRFPAAVVMAAFLTRGIGVEVMDNAAAARTFNVLATEGRRVVAAFMLGQSSPG